MFAGHDPYLVALSVVIAILGGYTGFGLAARIRGTPGVNRRLLLAGAAAFLAIGIWTMHFIGMLAAPIPANAVYLVLPTIASFLICALVVGVSLFFVSIGDPSLLRIIASAVLLGVGIASMHYVGMHALAGNFAMQHDRPIVLLSVLIAIVAAYGGLRAFIAQHGGVRLVLSAVAFGIAVSGMHYTAMYGMHFVPPTAAAHGDSGGLATSQQTLSLVVAVLCFVIAAGFLLSLVPEPRLRSAPLTEGAIAPLPDPETGAEIADVRAAETDRAAAVGQRRMPAPLGGLGQPPAPRASRLPLEGANGTHFVDVADVRSLRADAHYTLVHDGTRERMCLWSISEAETHLDPAVFVRVHRSHIVAIPHITFVRKEGDGAIVELDGPTPHLVPVSRAKIAELKVLLGVAGRKTHS